MRRMEGWRAALAQLELPLVGRLLGAPSPVDVEHERVRRPRSESIVGPTLARPSTNPDGERLRERLVRLGLRPEYRCRLTRNRTVVVSYAADQLRVHRGLVEAPDEVLHAIVTFVQGRTRRARNEARRTILAHPIAVEARRPRAPGRTHPDDLRFVARLTMHYHAYNRERFSEALSEIPIRVSRRMRSRLGHYTLPAADHDAEIVISRRHIRRHAWDEVLQTLLHEMVHQWQAETGRPVDHGRDFRAKAREVGCVPRAKRAIG